MIKIIFCLVAIIAMSGCDTSIKKSNEIITKLPDNYYKICTDGVFYIYGAKRLTVWINKETLKPQQCNTTKDK